VGEQRIENPCVTSSILVPGNLNHEDFVQLDKKNTFGIFQRGLRKKLCLTEALKGAKYKEFLLIRSN
jgi:hypothetical protein